MNLGHLSIFSLKDNQKIVVMMIISVLFFCLTLLQLSSLFHHDFPSQKSEQQSTTVKKQNVLDANSLLFKFPLFGDYIPVNLNAKEIKESMLDVKIVGILYSTNEKNSQIMIQSGDQLEKIYSVGDTLPGGVIIKRILRNGVVVLHNGTLEKLSLPKNILRFDKPAKPLVKE